MEPLAVPGHRNRTADRPQPRTLADLMTSIGMTNAVANIIMQLSLPAVGHGVSESRVASGNPRRHPIKRARTTTQYLAIAVLGDDNDRAIMREEVAKVHKEVHSTSDSPVRYSGNARDLQLWVAMCLYRYFLDQYTAVYGPLDDDVLDELTVAATPLATGLNVRPSEWPQTWDEFTTRWEKTVPDLRIDPVVREDFETLSNLKFLGEAWGTPGYALAALAGRPYQFFTRATLPAEFRDLMGWQWSEADQRRFEQVVSVMRIVDPIINPAVLKAMSRLYLVDFRLRHRLGLPVLGDLRVVDTMIRDGGGLRKLARRHQRHAA